MVRVDDLADYAPAVATSCSVRDVVKLSLVHPGRDGEQHFRTGSFSLCDFPVGELIGEPTRATRERGWIAAALTPALARIMVDAGRTVVDV